MEDKGKKTEKDEKSKVKTEEEKSAATDAGEAIDDCKCGDEASTKAPSKPVQKKTTTCEESSTRESSTREPSTDGDDEKESSESLEVQTEKERVKNTGVLKGPETKPKEKPPVTEEK